MIGRETRRVLGASTIGQKSQYYCFAISVVLKSNISSTDFFVVPRFVFQVRGIIHDDEYFLFGEFTLRGAHDNHTLPVLVWVMED